MKFLKKFNTLTFLAEKHHHVPVITNQKRYLGIILTLVGWMLAAFYTVLFQESAKKATVDISHSLSRIFIEFTFIHLAMFIFFAIFCTTQSQGIRYIKPKEPKLIWWRSIFSIISLWCYSLARVWTSTVDNSMLYSIDALCIIIFLWLLGIKVSKMTWVGIIIGVLGIAYVYALDIHSFYDILGGLFGTLSGITLAIITVITTYLVLQDPPLRIGIYQSFLGFSSSLIIAIVLGIFQGWYFPKPSELITMSFSGIFFGMMLFCIWEAFYYTEAYIIGALSYILPVFVEIINWILTKEVPSINTIIGTLVISTGCLIVVFEAYIEDRKKKRFADGRFPGEPKK